jgi:hypothetical protein
MDDILVLERPAKKKKPKRVGKVQSVVRVLRDEFWIGDILLDRRERVWRKVDSIPTDIVLKCLVAVTRGEERGELTGRRCGQTYTWHIVEEQQSTTESAKELAEAA